MSFNLAEFAYLAKCLEGLLFGIYSGIFVMHLKCDAIKREIENRKPNILFYALCLLYLFTMALFATEFASQFVDDVTMGYYSLAIAPGVLFGCCDFIAQVILIHRCWIVWGHNMRIVIIPYIVAFAYLVMWMAINGSVFIQQEVVYTKAWGYPLVVTSLTASMAVNALVTGLTVFKIFKVFREVKSVSTSEDIPFGITRRNRFRSVIFIIIESGMVLFIIQLARVVITITATGLTGAGDDAFLLISAIHEILNGIAPTIILVRVSLGLSFHDEESLVEAVGSLQFATNDPNPIRGTGSMDQDGSLHIGHDDPNPLSDMNQERRGGSDDIQMVER